MGFFIERRRQDIDDFIEYGSGPSTACLGAEICVAVSVGAGVGVAKLPVPSVFPPVSLSTLLLAIVVAGMHPRRRELLRLTSAGRRGWCGTFACEALIRFALSQGGA